jgi:hypothetical protein
LREAVIGLAASRQVNIRAGIAAIILSLRTREKGDFESGEIPARQRNALLTPRNWSRSQTMAGLPS